MLDQLHRTVALPVFPPRRIVSVVPSQTELLHALGLGQEVVGITKFCVHPAEWFQTKPRIGGTKTLNLEKIAALEPDLIIGNKEENDREQIEWLSARFPVWMSDIYTLDDAVDMIGRVGELCGRAAQAAVLCTQIREAFARLDAEVQGRAPLRAAYYIWRKPFMAAGSKTFIQDMLRRAGFENVFGHLERYPEVLRDDLKMANPDIILLSSEPFPFSVKHVAEFQDICPSARVEIVDGEMFSWYGNRLLLSADYFVKLRQSWMR